MTSHAELEHFYLQLKADEDMRVKMDIKICKQVISFSQGMDLMSNQALKQRKQPVLPSSPSKSAAMLAHGSLQVSLESQPEG